MNITNWQLFLHKFTTAQQLLTSNNFKDTSNCDAFKREVYVNTKLHDDDICYPRNWVLISVFIQGLWHDCILSRPWYFVPENWIPHLTMTYFLLWFLFSIPVDCNRRSSPIHCEFFGSMHSGVFLWTLT